MVQKVVQYAIGSNNLEVFKDGSVRVDGDLYPSIRDYERTQNTRLESVYPFWLVVNIKKVLGWRLLCKGGVYYEQVGKDFYKLSEGGVTTCKKPRGAVIVAWEKHPYCT